MLNQLFQKLFFFILPKFFLFRKAGAQKKEWWTYKYLKTKLIWKDIVWQELGSSKKLPNDIVLNRNIFVYWKQGFSNAPDLVKRCVSSIKSNANDYNIVYLDESNLKDYVSLPSFIFEKHDKGILKEAIFADLVRTNLLYLYGGVWCDATCFWSHAMDDIIESSPFFMFKAVKLNNLSPIECSNWFIKSNCGNKLLLKIQNFLFEWHRTKDYIPNYYIYHLVLSLLVNEDEECKEIWHKVPYYNNMSPHTLLFNWSSQYYEDYYNFLISSCFVQKLSYKFDSILLQKEPQNMLQHFMEVNKSMF